MVTLSEGRFFSKAEEVTSAIRERLGKSEEMIGKQPTPEQLEAVLRKIEAMKQQIREEQGRPRRSRYRALTRMLVDEWPLGHNLAAEIIELEDLYLKS